MKKILFFTMLITALFQYSLFVFAGEWEQENNKWKYKDDNEEYVIGEAKKIDGTWYFFDENGYMATGLFDYDGVCYSFDENGKPNQNNITYNGKTYKVNNKGEIKDMKPEELDDYRDTVSSQFILGGGYDSDLTELLNIGLKQAIEYFNNLPLSKKAFMTIFKKKLYNDDAIQYMINSCGINWKQQALKCAREFYTTYDLNREKLKPILIDQGFTEVEANYGTEMIFVDTTAIKGTDIKEKSVIEQEYLDKMSVAIIGEKISLKNDNTTTKSKEPTTEAKAAAYDPNKYSIKQSSSKFIYLNLDDDDAENGKVRIRVTASIPVFEGPRATELNTLVNDSLLNKAFKIASNNYYDAINRSKKLTFTSVRIDNQDATTLSLYLSGDFTVFVDIDLLNMSFK